MFVSDDNFRRWVLNPSVADEKFWQEYLLRYPNQVERVQEARAIVTAIGRHFDRNSVSTAELADSYTQLRRRMATEKNRPAPRTYRRIWRVAAAIAVVVSLSLFGWLGLRTAGGADKVYATELGERRELILPDGSHVNLNAGSRLTVSSDWDDRATREVRLEGEAYFKVRRYPATGRKFVVHTADLDVIVLGTQFNVNTADKTTEVTLEEGKIEVDFTVDPTLANRSLTPGEVIRYDTEQRTVELERADTRLYTSWKDGELVFEDARLTDIANRLERFYAITFVLSDRAENVASIRATLPTTSLEECLQSLELLLLSDGLSVTRENNTVRID
ncbi:MAG: FecR domain-containing protein [Saprospiraceae bacterium]